MLHTFSDGKGKIGGVDPRQELAGMTVISFKDGGNKSWRALVIGGVDPRQELAGMTVLKI